MGEGWFQIQRSNSPSSMNQPKRGVIFEFCGVQWCSRSQRIRIQGMSKQSME